MHRPTTEYRGQNARACVFRRCLRESDICQRPRALVGGDYDGPAGRWCWSVTLGL